METVAKDPRIAALAAKGDFADLTTALRYCMLLVGLREANLPSEEESDVLMIFIVKNYGGHTVKEIRLAFEMAVAGHFAGIDVKHYENFSVQYFASIMNAYRKWSASTYNQHASFDQVKQPEKWEIECEYCQVRAWEMQARIKHPLIDNWINKIQ